MNRDETMKVIQMAYELYMEGEYEKALPLLKRAADAGFVSANVLIGDCYWNGDGVEADATIAIQHYILAAKAGDEDGLLRMGDVYLQTGKTDKAVECFVEAYKKGNTDALFNLATIYYSGTESIKRDLDVAVEYLEQYINLLPNDDEALYLLGKCYLFMKNSNHAKAEEMFERSASLGNAQAAKDRDALRLGGYISNA